MADTAAKLVALKQFQPLMEVPMLVTDVFEDWKDHIMEAQHLDAQQNRSNG